MDKLKDYIKTLLKLAIQNNPEVLKVVRNAKATNLVVQNYNQNQPRVPKGNPNGGQFAGTNKYIDLSKKPIENFYDLHRNLAEPAPAKYTGDTTFKAVLTYLGSKDGRSAIIETPAEKVIFNRNNLNHIIIDHPERLSDLNKMVRTLQAPNLIISELKDGKDYNYYIKNFQEADKNKAQFEVVKIAPDGSFFSTSYPLRSNKFTQIINGGQIIFDLTHDTTAIQKNVSVNTIITDNREDFNPDIKNNVQNNKEQDMTLLDELKKLITKVENGKGEDMDENEVKNEKVDKRKLIDEVAGIMKSAGADEEKIRTAIAKMEKLAYDKSEAGTADNEKEDEHKDDKPADNSKVKNEESKEDEKKYDDLKKNVKEDVQNKCKNSVDNSKGGYFDKMNEIYNAATQPAEENTYISREQKLKYAEEYFAK